MTDKKCRCKSETNSSRLRSFNYLEFIKIIYLWINFYIFPMKWERFGSSLFMFLIFFGYPLVLGCQLLSSSWTLHYMWRRHDTNKSILSRGIYVQSCDLASSIPDLPSLSSWSLKLLIIFSNFFPIGTWTTTYVYIWYDRRCRCLRCGNRGTGGLAQYYRVVSPTSSFPHFSSLCPLIGCLNRNLGKAPPI